MQEDPTTIVVENSTEATSPVSQTELTTAQTEDPLVPMPVLDSCMRRYKQAAVAADNAFCSEIGRDVLLNGNGNAVDAAIATLFCNGVKNAHSMGLGGGLYMVIFNSTTGRCTAIDGRETAPRLATDDNLKNQTDRRQGWKSIGVPGELMTYWEAFSRFGSRPWADLVKPSLRMTRTGFHVDKAHADALKFSKDVILKEPTMSIYINPETNEVYKEGERILLLRELYGTLGELANSADPTFTFYKGKLAHNIVNEIQDGGGLMTRRDLAEYKVRVNHGWNVTLENGLTVCTLDAPSGGPVVGLYLALLNKLGLNSDSLRNKWSSLISTYHKMIESLKFSYSFWNRFEDMNPDIFKITEQMRNDSYVDTIVSLIRAHDSPVPSRAFYDLRLSDGGSVSAEADLGGTSHLSVVDKWGNAVAATSSINYYFGSKMRGKSTGIIFNNHMADFAFNPNKSRNRIKAGRRPRSAMAPVIVIDRKTKRAVLTIGASGGSKIPSSIAFVAGRVLFLNETVKQATDAARFHTPVDNLLKVQAESLMPQEYITRLEGIGHNFIPWTLKSVVQSIHQINGEIFAMSDSRKGGYPSGY